MEGRHKPSTSTALPFVVILVVIYIVIFTIVLMTNVTTTTITVANFNSTFILIK